MGEPAEPTSDQVDAGRRFAARILEAITDDTFEGLGHLAAAANIVGELPVSCKEEDVAWLLAATIRADAEARGELQADLDRAVDLASKWRTEHDTSARLVQEVRKRADASASDVVKLTEELGRRLEMIKTRDARVAELEANASVSAATLAAQSKSIADLRAKIAELEPLAKRPEGGNGPMWPQHSPRPRAAGEVIPPEQRASWARGKTEHDT